MQVNPWDFIHWFALPADVSKLLHKPWTIISYMFLHEGFLHILFNLLWLYFGGQIFIQYLNSKQLVSTYVLGGIFGGLSYILAFNLFPAFQQNLSQSMAIGASCFGISSHYRYCYLCTKLLRTPHFLGRVKLKHIAIFSILLDIISIPKGNAGGHIAHLGGALYGFCMYNN